MSQRTAGGLQSVLIVTGSDRTRRMYGEYLTWRGIRVREVHTASEAVGALSAALPDAIVVEDRLPDSTGLELVRALRRSRYTFDLPLLLLCSDTFAIQAEEASDHGCDRILLVPVLPEALLETLSSLIQECSSARGARPFESWLFTKGDESVWMVRITGLELVVAGPGPGRAVFTFSAERELLPFQAEYEQRLRRSGFRLETSGADRRSGRDRRHSPRPGVVERRAVM